MEHDKIVSPVKKEERLEEMAATWGTVAVAYCGGFDSSYLADVAVEVLGKKVWLFIADTPSFPRSELSFALELAHARGWLERQPGELPVGGPDRGHAGGPVLLHGFPPGPARSSVRLLSPVKQVQGNRLVQSPCGAGLWPRLFPRFSKKKKWGPGAKPLVAENLKCNLPFFLYRRMAKTRWSKN